MTSGTPHDFAANRILGHEYSGEVVAVGSDATGFRPGDCVTALPSIGCGQCAYCRGGNEFLCQSGRTSYMGGFAQFVTVGARAAIKLPSTLSLSDGALVEPLAVGVHAARLAALKPHHRILVLGSGPIGLAVAYAAQHLGVTRIAIASRSDRRAPLAAQMGFHTFITTGEHAGEQVRDALNGQPDCVFECVGLPGALDQSIAFVKPDGVVISIGTCALPDPVNVVRATAKQARIVFSMGYTLEEFQAAAGSLDKGHTEPRLMVSGTISLDETPDMIATLRAGSAHTKVQVDAWL